MLFRAMAIWLIIALAEIAQGTLRVKLLNPRVGDHRARQIAVFTGSFLILLIAWLSAPWLGMQSSGDAMLIGLLWLVLMLGLEICFGRWVFHMKWKKIFEDFDLRRGRLLVLGMIVLTLAPWIVGKLRAMW